MPTKWEGNGTLTTWPKYFKFKLDDGTWVGKKYAGHTWTPYHEDAECPVCGDLGRHSKEAHDEAE